MTTDRPTRVANDLLDDAAREGARESRSAKQQLDHWARVGRAVSMRHTNQRLRVEAALAGALSLSALSDQERQVVDAEWGVGIKEAATAMSFGARLAAEGITTVALDDDGRIIEHSPDGTTRVVG
jgi:hypothetical protein